MTIEEEREEIIKIAMNTPNGRQALAQAMIAPIICSLKYQSDYKKYRVEKCPEYLKNS